MGIARLAVTLRWHFAALVEIHYGKGSDVKRLSAKNGRGLQRAGGQKAA